MNRTHKLLGIVSLTIMVALTACGGNKNATNETSAGAAGNSGAKAASYELNVAFATFNGIPSNIQEVQDAISKITLEKINATVKLTPINGGSWTQQQNLMLSSNEKLDLMYVSGKTYSSMVAKGQLVKLDDLLNDYGQDIKKVFDESYLNAGKLNGSIYIVPSNRDLATYYAVNLKQEYLDKYSIDPSTIHSIDDLDAVFQKIRAGEPNMPILVPQSAGFTFIDSYRWFDILGDGIGVLPNFDNDLKVVNLYETPEYVKYLGKIRGWYEAGYILPDAATVKDGNLALLKANKGIGYLSNQKQNAQAAEVGVEDSRGVGAPMIQIPLTDTYATTSTVTSVNWGIPLNAKHPDLSMKFMNLMYSDKDIVNLLDWGIPDKDYVKKSNNIIDYPAGIDSTTVAYNLNQGWMFGNQFLAYLFPQDDPETYTKLDALNKGAIKSKALGFTFNAEPVKTEYAAVTNVINQYKLPLETGSVDPNEILPEFIAKLKSSGIDIIIAEKQKQLDEWAAANK